MTKDVHGNKKEKREIHKIVVIRKPIIIMDYFPVITPSILIIEHIRRFNRYLKAQSKHNSSDNYWKRFIAFGKISMINHCEL